LRGVLVWGEKKKQEEGGGSREKKGEGGQSAKSGSMGALKGRRGGFLCREKGGGKRGGKLQCWGEGQGGKKRDGEEMESEIDPVREIPAKEKGGGTNKAIRGFTMAANLSGLKRKGKK